MECFELGSTVPEHALIRNGVPAVDRLRLVADHSHRRRAGHTGSFEIPDRRPAEVMRDAKQLDLPRLLGDYLGEARLEARGQLSPTDGSDRPAATVKNPGHDAPGLLGDGLCPLPLALQDRPEFGREGEHATFAVLGLTWFEAEPAVLEIHVCPLASEEFGLDAPTRHVRDLEYGLEIIW